MNKKKNILLFTGITLLLVAGVIGISYALGTFLVSSDTINKVSTPKLSVALTEVYKTPDKPVYPSESVDKIVNATNTGNIDSLIRIKVTKEWGVRGDDGVLAVDDTLSGDNILIEYDSTKWIYGNDGYYYYRGILEPNKKTEVPLFTKYTIDENTDNEYQGKDANIRVEVESIQAEANAISTLWNKSYDFLGLTEPEPTVDLGTTAVTLISPSDKFNIETSKTDLFVNFKDLIPGTGRTQEITVTNNYINEQPIYVRADVSEQDESYTDEQITLINKLLREYITITVKNEGSTIYSGPVWGNLSADSTGTCSISTYNNELDCRNNNGTWTSSFDSMKTNIYLGNFQPEETKSMIVTLNISPDVTNEYMDLIGNVKWVFTTEFRESSLLVHHYRIGTTERVPSDTTGNIVKDEYYLGSYNAKYTTKPSVKVSPRYTLVATETVGCDGTYDEETGICKGVFAEGEHEVNYYYRLTTPGYDDPVIDKSGDLKLSDLDSTVHYDINYSVKVTEYKGQFVLTVTDQLPAEIDPDLSDIDGGTYNVDDKTITWVTFVTLDTYTTGPTDILFERSIDLKYTSYDFEKGLISNTVSSKMTFLEIPYSPEPITDDHDVELDITGNLTVEHYIYGTDTKLSTEGPTEEKVGTSYTTNPISLDDYEVMLDETVGCPTGGYDDETGTCNGKYVNGDTVIKYYYRLKNAVYDEPSINKDGDEKVSSKTDSISYSVAYSMNVTKYIGDAVLTVVDQLPEAIDDATSVLDGGVYDDENLTITWTVNFDDINTVADGDYNIEFSRNITLFYLDYDYDAGSVNNEVSGVVSFVDTEEITEPVKDDHEVAIDIKTKLTVEHYIDGTDILLDTEGPTEEVVGTEFATHPKVYDYYNVILDKTVGCQDGEYDAQNGTCSSKFGSEDVVIKYYYTLKDPVPDNSVIKEGPSVITSKDSAFEYQIIYNAHLSNYNGNATVTIVDKLPYLLDDSYQEQDLAGGIYDKDNKTITWTYDVTDIKLEFEKVYTLNIKVKFVDIDYTKNIVNTSVGTLKYGDTEIPSTGEVVTETKIPAKVIVNHYYEGTTIKVDDTNVIDKLYGEEYTTSQSEKAIKGGYTFVYVEGTVSGIVDRDEIVINYYYSKVENPYTGDNLITYITILAASFVVLGTSVFLMIKNNKELYSDFY